MCQCIIQSKISFELHRASDYCTIYVCVRERDSEKSWNNVKIIRQFPYICFACSSNDRKNYWKLCVKIIRFVCFYVDELSNVLYISIRLPLPPLPPPQPPPPQLLQLLELPWTDWNNSAIRCIEQWPKLFDEFAMKVTQIECNFENEYPKQDNVLKSRSEHCIFVC